MRKILQNISLYTSEGDYTFLKRQNTQFNYLLSWHVVVMKERVLNINRAKLTSQMGFRRGNPSAIHLHIKLLSSIWNKTRFPTAPFKSSLYLTWLFDMHLLVFTPTKKKEENLVEIKSCCPWDYFNECPIYLDSKPQCNIYCKYIFHLIQKIQHFRFITENNQ